MHKIIVFDLRSLSDIFSYPDHFFLLPILDSFQKSEEKLITIFFSLSIVFLTTGLESLLLKQDKAARISI